MRKLNSSRGMTLVEVLTAVSILVILIAVAVPQFQGWRQRTQQAACQANVTALQQEVDAWQLKHRQTWTQLSASVGGSDPVWTKMHADYTCPSGGIYEITDYGVVYCTGPSDTIVGTIPVKELGYTFAQKADTIIGDVRFSGAAAGFYFPGASGKDTVISDLNKMVPGLENVSGTWTIAKKDAGIANVQLFWTDVDMNDGTHAANEYVVFIKYNLTNNNNYTGLYSVWRAPLKKDTSGKLYLQQQDLYKEYTASKSADSATKKDYNAMWNIFLEAKGYVADSSKWI